MPPKFGTSGLRGLVVDLTDDLVSDYITAFITVCPSGGCIHIGQDLRPSSKAIAAVVERAANAAGVDTINHGALPTPALALASMSLGHSAVMVTGSHIPADRNGLKFYVPCGEISKSDEEAINAALGQPIQTAKVGTAKQETSALPAFIDRYVGAFGSDALAGQTIGVYQHSSVARDVMCDVIAALGATPVALARSDIFIPVDTEAVDPGTRTMLATWAQQKGLDAIVSTDGDGDRPMVAGPDGAIIPGDRLGPMTAELLGADVLVTPVSSNSLIHHMPSVKACHLTRIGSPFVVAQIEQVLADDAATKVVGYEANGGFLLAYTAACSAGPLAPLLTRDSILPIVAPLVSAKTRGLSLTEAAATLPARFTAAGRVQDIPTDKSVAFIGTLINSQDARAAFFTGVEAETGTDLTDGLRVTFACGTIVHLRPSGNAPECRCYVEASNPQNAQHLAETHLALLEQTICG